jgi:hypothetical protein
MNRYLVQQNYNLMLYLLQMDTVRQTGQRIRFGLEN